MVMASSATKEIIDLTVDPDEDSVDEDRDREDTEDWHFVVELSAATHRYTRIVGIRYYPGTAHPGEYVDLQRETQNPYDPNAIRVDNMHGMKVGHIKRELAAILSPIMAAHGNSLKVDATIPGPGNQFELPLCLRLYGSALSDGSVEQQLAKIAYKPLRAVQPFPVEVRTRPLDWTQQQKYFDELFESQQREKLSNLPDVELPRSLTSTLLEHQWTGVRWLVSREKNQDLPFWKQVSERGSTKWLCEVTNSSQSHAPTPAKGSILADDMGLGKTIQTIALILAHAPLGRDYNQPLNAAASALPRKQDAIEDDVDVKMPAKKMPRKSTVKKLKLPVLLSLEMQTAVDSRSMKKGQLVNAVLGALDSDKLSIQDYYETSEKSGVHGSSLNGGNASMIGAAATLIVCPVSVISNWQEQIDAHVAPNTLRVALYHGPGRHELIQSYDPTYPIDVLITSYQTLALDYRPIRDELKKRSVADGDEKKKLPSVKRFKGQTSIFSFPFRRVVLDEAHTVRNASSGIFHAANALQATYRLCLTGTPLQNKPDDIQSLFDFLRIEPFRAKDIFRRSISQPIRDGDTDTGLGLLRNLMSHFALRRCKSAVRIDLPSKVVELREVHAPFNSPQHRIYDVIYDSAKAAIRASIEALGGGGNSSSNEKFLAAHFKSVFEILTRLRQACCSEKLVPVERVEPAEQVLEQLKIKSEAGQALSPEEATQLLGKLMGALGSCKSASRDDRDKTALPECAICMESMNKDRIVVLRGCGHVFCHVCLEKMASSTNGYGDNAGKCPFCRHSFAESDMIPWKTAAQAASAANEYSEQSTRESRLSEQIYQLGPSPKLEALVASMAEMKQGEKCVIFSQFAKFLDGIGLFLASQGRTFLRIDGSKTQAQRQLALSSFASDSDGSPDIMLCSLHAAGTGINLTRANHIYMMDTWWNKAVETQAFDRVHRIGQTRPVRVVRFVAANSIESRMVQLQEQKAAMGKGAFEALTAEDKRKARFGDIQKLLEL